jgi:heme exporter protein D
MSWASWSDFVSMGGYALYVWGAYGVTAAFIAGEVVLVVLRSRKAAAQARMLAAQSGDRA